MAHIPLSATEGSYIEAGLLHLEHLSDASSSERSALVPLLAGLAARMSGAENRIVELSDYRFVIRAPFLVAGLLLGASLWFVARRLYGNIGGYIALGLYCFSPVMIGWSSQVGPGIVAAWGSFGLIFTAIAVAHTLYAPREVVLWNWRRILLLGLSIAICIGAQFSLWILLVPALGFMLWVGHVRPGAALAIFAAACVTGLLLLWALYSFRPAVFGMALRNADWLEVSAVRPLLAQHLFLVCGVLPAERNRFSFITGSYSGHVHRLEARTLFRNSGSAHGWRLAGRVGHSYALAGIHFSSRRATVLDPFYGRSFDRPVGGSSRVGCQRRHRWGADCQCHDRRLRAAPPDVAKPITTFPHPMGWTRLKGTCWALASWKIRHGAGAHSCAWQRLWHLRP